VDSIEKEPLAFCKVTRERVDNFIKLFNDFRKNDFAHLAEDVEKIGKRPSWLIAIVIIILTNITVGLTLAQISGR